VILAISCRVGQRTGLVRRSVRLLLLVPRVGSGRGRWRFNIASAVRWWSLPGRRPSSRIP